MTIINKGFISLFLLGLIYIPANAEEFDGLKLYQANCLKCHQADGGGVPFKSASLDMFSIVGGDVGTLIRFVDKGTKNNPPGDYDDFMPSFKVLSNAELASVLTFIRSNFGNEADEVSSRDVSLVRGPLGQEEGRKPSINLGIEEVIVSAGKLPPSKSDQAYAIITISAEELDNIPSLRLDDKLRSVAGFSLFRRSSSRVAHPTTQGVTLRSMGPNGAGRTLLLLDGIPQNDPFGGWVYWSALENDYLDGINVIKGAGAGRWGSGALAGTLSMTSQPISQKGLFGQASFGVFNTLDAGARVNFKGETSGSYISGHFFESDGYYLIGADQRGLVDLKASSNNQIINIGSDVDLEDGVSMSFKAGYLNEHRVNGLALSTNDTESYNLSLGFVGFKGEDQTSWQFNTYYRNVDFKNSFASVDSERATTRMVLDQFSVPGRGMGANGLVRIPFAEGNTLEIGFDARAMKGETNERNRNLGQGFTRLRVAGGKEALFGGYAEYINDFNLKVTFTAGLRWDYWSTSNGQRFETDTVNNVVVRQGDIEDRSGSLMNARAGVGYHIYENVTLKASAYSGFRLPTINEFFRPFRVGNDITEANPDLEPEKLKGIDFGVEFDVRDQLYLTIGYFYNKLENGVGNVTLAFGPGFFPPTGFVPSGGSLRQRQNIDEIVAQGVEISLKTQITNNLRFEGSVVSGTAVISAFATSPSLEGMQLSQSPKTVASASLQYVGSDKWSFRADVRHTSWQFEDDRNLRTLPAYTVINLGANYKLMENISVHFILENMLDESFLTAINGTGLRTLGQPLTWTFGLKANF